MSAPTEDVIARARALLERVTFDDRGTMVAGKNVGGNGGLLSRETIIAAEQLRNTLDDFDAAQARPADVLLDIAARAVIRTAECPASRRGPWIVDESELEQLAQEAREFLAARGLRQ